LFERYGACSQPGRPGQVCGAELGREEPSRLEATKPMKGDVAPPTPRLTGLAGESAASPVRDRRCAQWDPSPSRFRGDWTR
jgi:hypothetical protein